MRLEVSQQELARTRSGALRHTSLAAFGGIPAVPPGRVVPWPAANARHLQSLARVVNSGKYHRVNHPIVQELKPVFSEWTGCWHARAVATGTAAIHIALDHFKSRGRFVVAAAPNWPGAIGPIHFSGLERVFVDVALDDAVADQEAATVALDADVGVVLITHLYGNAAFVPELRAAVRRRGALVDDAPNPLR